MRGTATYESTRERRFWGGGEPFIWLTGGALTLSLILVAGLIALILVNGLGFFWPKDVARVTLADGVVLTGQIVDREPIPDKRGQYRIKLKVANRDLYGADFQWVPESQVTRRAYPADVAVIERTEWGMLIGTLKEVRDGGRVIASGPEQSWEVVRARLPGSEAARREIRRIEVRDIGAINREQERLRLAAAAPRAARRPRRPGGGELSRPSWPRCSSATMSRRRASRSSGRASRRASWSRPIGARRRSCPSRR